MFLYNIFKHPQCYLSPPLFLGYSHASSPVKSPLALFSPSATPLSTTYLVLHFPSN